MSWLENAINNQIKNAPEVSQSGSTRPVAKSPISKVPVGNIFKGDIVNVSDKNVTIRLENGQTMQARLQENYQFNIGQRISFEVKSNNGTMIEIRPIITTEDGANSTVMKALIEAGLPVNEKTVQLLKILMNEQMPINKNSLMGMYKLMLSNGSADPATLVSLTKLNVPVTPENITQFENYTNFQHQISEQVSEISNELPQILGELATEGNINLGEFNVQLLSLIKMEDTADSLNPLLNAQIAQNEIMTGEVAEISNDMQNDREGAVLNTTGQDGEMPTVLNENEAEITKNPAQGNPAQGNTDNPPLNQMLSKEELIRMAATLKNTGIDENQIKLLSDGKITVNDFFAAIGKFAEEGKDLRVLFKNSGYHKLLSAQLENSFLMKPEDVFEKDNVEQYYSRLKEHTSQINNMLEMVGRGSSVVAKQAAGISENIDFMNQINQMFTYVQFPLKMADDSAHGDLYVFTNKRNLHEKKGRISALLHLDMTLLGTMDIYVELEKNAVNASFRMEDNEKLDFIKNNIDRLVERLEDRGYTISTDFRINDREAKEEFEEFISTPQTPMQRYSFDVRA